MGECSLVSEIVKLFPVGVNLGSMETGLYWQRVNGRLMLLHFR